MVGIKPIPNPSLGQAVLAPFFCFMDIPGRANEPSLNSL